MYPDGISAVGFAYFNFFPWYVQVHDKAGISEA
jgi:hypothetical protein